MLDRLAKIIAEWAEGLPLKCVYIFGSRVRGDYQPGSDLDVAIEYADNPTGEEMQAWQRENESDFEALKQAIGVPLSLHADQSDVVWPAIRAGAKAPVLVLAKVCCVRTPAK